MTAENTVSKLKTRSIVLPTEPCDEYIDFGPFRFECGGHFPGDRRRAVERHGGKLEHYSTSPQSVGDANVTFWTMIEG